MMRLGSTSYVYHADIITNVNKLAGVVQDMELVIFELHENDLNLPDEAVVAEISERAREHGMTFTVHFPLDFALASPNNGRSIERARRVMDATADLDPYAFIIHVESAADETDLHRNAFCDNAVRALEILAEKADGYERLCVENLEGEDITLMDAIVDRLPVSYCVDVGHLWKDGLPAETMLAQRLPRTRVVHLHGVADRDHTRLSVMPDEKVDPIVEILDNGFNGVVTLEVFSTGSLFDSLEAVRKSRERIRSKRN